MGSRCQPSGNLHARHRVFDLTWGFRIRMVLGHDRPTLPGYDQDLWAERMRYGDVEPADSLQRFRFIRTWNLDLLRSCEAQQMKRMSVHTERGEESLEHMIRLYAGHDLVHLRQLARIRERFL